MATKKAARKAKPEKKLKRSAPKKKQAKPALARKPKPAPRKKPARIAPDRKLAKTAPGKKPARIAPDKKLAKPAPGKKFRRVAPRIRKPLPPPPFVAVGDWVSLRPGGAQPGALPIERDGEVAQGIICSIREIATGKLVAKTRDELEGYLLEVLHHRTFRPQFSSSRNVGPATAGTIARSPAWRKMQEILRNAAKERRFFSYATGGLPNELFGSLLDGWRVVRVRAAAVESRE